MPCVVYKFYDMDFVYEGNAPTSLDILEIVLNHRTENIPLCKGFLLWAR